MLTGIKRWPVLAATTVIAFAMLCFFVTVYHEWFANWWGLTIWFFAILIAGIVALIAYWLDLFEPSDLTPNWILVCVLGYMILSIFLGLFFCEPLAQQAAANNANQQQSQDYNWDHTRTGGFFYTYIFIHDSSSGAVSAPTTTTSSSSSSGKGAGYVFLLIILIVLIPASAIIPHFWICAVLAGVVLLALFTLKEYKVEQVGGIAYANDNSEDIFNE
jgi:hypothetical protein